MNLTPIPFVLPATSTPGPTWRHLGLPMDQNCFAVPAWDWAISQHIKPARIIELGTGHGGFTVALGILGRQQGFPVHTFDLNSYFLTFQPWFEFLAIYLHYPADLTEPGTKAQVENLITSSGTTLLLCDNGNKQQEFNDYAPFLKPGDVIAAHDYAGKYWGHSEIRETDVEQMCADHNLTPFLPALFADTGWLVKRCT